MNRQILWSPWQDEVRLEHLHIRSTGSGYTADSLVIGVDEIPYRIAYQVVLDEAFCVREISLHNTAPGSVEVLQLSADGQGYWTSEGQPLPQFDGCLYVDISFTPFTNTLPIRRLQLKPGQAQEIEVVYIAVPAMQLSRFRQRYTCLKVDEDGGVYRYESLDKSRFKSELTVDHDGLVLEYKELFSQVWIDE